MSNLNFRAETQNKRLRLDIYDTIGADWLGQGITAKSVSAAIAGAGDVDQIDVYINSPGGDAFDGIAIYNELKQFEGQVNTYAMGVAASAASLIFMAGDQRVVYDGAQLMIHNAAGFTFGDKQTHEKQCAVLAKLDQNIAKVYANTTGGDIATIAELMNEETWLDTDDAVADGYATHRSPQEAVAPPAARMLNAYSNVPLKVAAWAGQNGGLNPLPTTEQPTMEDQPMKPEEDEEVVAEEHDEEKDEGMTEEEMKARIAELEAQVAELMGEDDEEDEEEDQPVNHAKVIAARFSHDKDFVVEMVSNDKTIDDALWLYVDRAKKLSARNTALESELSNGEDPVALAPRLSNEFTDNEVRHFKAAAQISETHGARSKYLADVNLTPERFEAWTAINPTDGSK